MLKSQDIVLLLKLLSHPKESLGWSQNQLATYLCISASEVNAGIKRLNKAGLFYFDMNKRYQLSAAACEELLISGVKYFFPAQVGEYTRGIATSYAAPIFEKQIILGQDPIPVWPFAEGNRRGLALKPLYPSVPKSLAQYPDQTFYDLLALVDAIRQGRARERNIAMKLLKERLNHGKPK